MAPWVHCSGTHCGSLPSIRTGAGPFHYDRVSLPLLRHDKSSRSTPLEHLRPCITGDERYSSRCEPPGHGMASPEPSRFPRKKRARMLGVSDRAEPEKHSRWRAPRCGLPLAHQRRRSGLTACAAPYLANVSPYRLLVCPLAETSARLGAEVVRSTFPGLDLLHILLTGLPAHLGDLLPGTGR